MEPEVLAPIPLFSGLQPSELASIATHAVLRHYPRHCVLVNEGEHSDSLFVILEGRVKVYASDPDGKEILLSQLGPGECFGELAVIDEEPRSASVMTIEPCRLAIILRRDFNHCLHQHPSIAINLLRTMAGKFRRELETIKSLALENVYQRVVRILNQLAVEQPDGTRVAEALTQRRLGHMVGASREMVSLVLKELKAGGYIQVQRGRIILLKPLPSNW